MTDKELIRLLKRQHSDIKQGAYYTTNEDPYWDVTLDAAERLEEIDKLMHKLSKQLTREITTALTTSP